MRKNNKGFTLIELLVVISIIALLLAILMPSLNKAKEQARKVYCSANSRSIGTAAINFSVNNNDWLPMLQAKTLRGTKYASLYPHRGMWYEDIAPYMDYSNVSAYKNFFNAEARTAAQEGYDAPKSIACPSFRASDVKVAINGKRLVLKKTNVITVGFGWNWRGGGYGIMSDGTFPESAKPRKYSTVRNASIAGLVGENRWDAAESRPWAWAGQIPVTPGGPPGQVEYYYGNRHNVGGDFGGNYICVDGHVEYKKYSDLVDDWKGTQTISVILPDR